MLIDKVYSAVAQIANKDQVSGVLTPAEFNKYAELAQREYISRNYNSPVRQGYESTFKMTDELSDIKSTSSIVVSSGRATVPTDYLHYSSCYGLYIFNGEGRTVPVELVRDDEWAERLASEVNKPSKRFPIMKRMSTYFEVYPQEMNTVQLTYLKLPDEPWWNYTLSGSTPVFSSGAGITTNPNTNATGASTDFTVGDFSDYVWMICQYLGLNLREEFLFSGANREEGEQ